MNKHLTVLIIDDDEELRAATVRLLPKDNLEVYQAGDGKTGLDLIHAHRPELVISDVDMPEITGIDLCQLVKQDPTIHNTLFVLISHQKITSKDKIKGLEALADFYLTRPISNNELKSHIKAFLRIVSDEKELRESNARLTYMNSIIKSVQKVNQLISKTDKIDELIDSSCSVLVESLGYNNAWIALGNKPDQITHIAGAGFGNLKQTLEEIFKDNRCLMCMDKATNSNGIAVIEDPKSECNTCPLSEWYGDYCGLCYTIKSDGRIFGWLTVSAPKQYAYDKTQWRLLEELAGDLGHALYTMELKAAQEKSQAERNMFFNMVSQTQDMIAIVNKDHIIEQANPMVRHFFKKTELVNGIHVSRLLGEDLYNRCGKQNLLRAFKGNQTSFVANVPMPGRKPRYFNVHITPDSSTKSLERVYIVGTDITDLMQASKKLEQSERKYHNLYDSIPAGTAIIDIPSGEIREVNLSLCSMLGYEESELLYKTVEEITHPEDYKLDQQALDERLEGDSSINFIEKRLLKKDGSYVWASVSSTPIEFENAVPKTILGIIIDNTELVGATKALEQSEKRYKSLAENYPNGTVALFNRELVCEHVDGKGLETIGLKKEDLIGRNIYEIFPEDIARIKEENWTNVFNGETSSYEVFFKNHTFTTTVVPIRNTEGKILQGAEFSQDITWLRRYQNEQEKSKTLLEMSEDIAGSGSFETDYTKQEILVSKGWQQIHGINKDLITVEEFLGIVKPEEVETMIKICEKARAEHTEYNYQIRIINQKTRDIRHTKVIGKYKYNENGEVLSMVGSVQDITEQKRVGEEKIKMAEELRQSQKMEAIGALAGGVAHDFNNIMQSVIGYSQLMLESLPKDSLEYDHASEIFRGAERAAAITRQLLAFGRRQVLEPTEIDLNKHIASIQDLLERTTKESIRVSFSPKRGLPLVSVDKNQLTQLILNVVINARDAMPNGGIVELATSQVHIDKSYNESCFTSTEKPGEGMYVMLRISDTGEGISQGVLSHIFEPFYTTKAVGKGTGMGLSSVYGIIRQHGGAIRAESKVGKGSSFFIYLPAVAKGTSKKDISVPDDKKPEKGSGCILFAEDEAVLRKLSKKVLGDYGYTMIIAENGQEALDLGRENIYNIDILVFDAVMPKMSGIDAYKALRELRPELPVIFTSGYTESEIHSNYILKHGLTFIQKPYSLKDLLKKIQELLPTSND